MDTETDYYLPGYNAWKDEDLEKKENLLPYMKSMVLNGAGITDRGLSLLSRCTKLKELHLNSTGVTNDGLRHISQLKSLNWISIDESIIGDKGLHHLSSLANLQSLQLVNTVISDDAMEVLFNFPEIQYLETISDHIGEKAISIIAKQPSLKTLRMASNTIGDNDFYHFALCSNLRSLTYDMPLVSNAAFEELNNRLPECEIERFNHFDSPDRFGSLMIHVMNLYRTGQYDRALNAVNDAIGINSNHPIGFGFRALIHLKLGTFQGFWDNMLSLRNLSVRYRDLNLEQLAVRYLGYDKLALATVVIAKERPDEILMGTLYTVYKEKPKPVSRILRPNFLPVFQPPPIQVPKQFAQLPTFSDRNEVLSGYEKWAEEQRQKATKIVSGHIDYIPQPKPEQILLEKFRRALIRERDKDSPPDRESRGQLPPWQW